MVEESASLYPRGAGGRISAALADTPVVFVVGPRQCGKTTLVRTLVSDTRSYVTLDDETALAAARADPTGFTRSPAPITIDEVQRAPDLLRAIKRAVDDTRTPGRFLLTGSADILALPTVAESLAGRMEIVTLLPLAQAELNGLPRNALDLAFAGQVATPATTGADLVGTVLVGGYPEMLRRPDPSRRAAWARDYVRAIVERDIRDIADVGKLDQVPLLLRALAHQSGQLTNFAELSGQLRMDDKTARRYVGILEQVFLVRRLEPWFRNPLKRLIRTPKLHFLDAGLLATLTGATKESVRTDRTLFGPLLETFVVSEILKLATWSTVVPTLYHYRDKDQNEVDVLLEDEIGRIVGIEVKASATVRAADFRGLHRIADAAGERFSLGLVLYDGDRIFSFGDRLLAAPVSCLWGAASTPAVHPVR